MGVYVGIAIGAVLAGIVIGILLVTKLAARLTVHPSKILGFINLVKAQQTAALCRVIINALDSMPEYDTEEGKQVIAAVKERIMSLEQHGIPRTLV